MAIWVETAEGEFGFGRQEFIQSFFKSFGLMLTHLDNRLKSIENRITSIEGELKEGKPEIEKPRPSYTKEGNIIFFDFKSWFCYLLIPSSISNTAGPPMTNQDPQTILTARLHKNKKRHPGTRWQFNDLALLKTFKDNALRLWEMRCLDRKINRLADWKIGIKIF